MPHTPPDSAGVFAPGHLGELTQLVTPALVDQVLSLTRRTQQRVRMLPARVMVYFVLAMALFPRQGYRGVWASLTAGLGIPTPDPSTSALSQARRRLGPTPLTALFDAMKGCAAGPDTQGAWWRGLRVLAWDSTLLDVADTPANEAFFGRHTARHGVSGYPSLRLSVLVECGTRALVEAVHGPQTEAEQAQLTRLCASLRPGTLVLADRGSTGHALVGRAAQTGAHLLWRVAGNRFLPVLQALPDGSYVSLVCDPVSRGGLRAWLTRKRQDTPPVTGVRVRVIQAVVTVTAPTGVVTSSPVRLITTLLDAQRYPARELAALYHQRWEVETAYAGVKVTMREGGRVLRSTVPSGVVQELYGLLIVYHLARGLAARAATERGIDPDRISLTVTLRAARHSLVLARTAGGGEGLAGAVPAGIRHAMLNPRELGPKHRRSRILPRRVKRPVSPFAYNKTRHDESLSRVRISYSITPPTPDLTPGSTT